MHEDFDVNEMAAYLHLTPQQVLKMAERGRLPGRKIGGQWKFSSAEVHHWLEDRIGLSDEGELAAVESVLNRQATDSEAALELTQLLPAEAVAIPLQARTRSSVIAAMCELVSTTGLLWDPDKMEEAVRAREELHPTALDNGIALLHPRRPQSTILAQSVIGFGRTHHGIPFGGGGLTDIFFLICSTSDQEHLRILARLSRILAAPDAIDALRETETGTDVIRVLAGYDEQFD